MPGRNVTIVAGISGTGKTTFALRYLANAELSTRFIFDPDPGEAPLPPDLGEFAARLKLPPANDVHTLGLSLCRGWALFDPHALFPGNLQTAFEFFCDLAYEKSLAIPGRKILVIDEAYAYQTPHGVPAELLKCVQSGRKRGLHVMVLMQQPNRLNDAIKSAVSEFVCFRIQAPAALDLVKDYYGFNPDAVSSLAPLQFVARNVDTGGELRGKIKI